MSKTESTDPPALDSHDPASERALKVTAALYERVPGVVEHVRANGCLPPTFTSVGGGDIGLRVLIERRGVDCERTADERLVLEAIKRASHTPAGRALLVEQDDVKQKGK